MSRTTASARRLDIFVYSERVPFTEKKKIMNRSEQITRFYNGHWPWSSLIGPHDPIQCQQTNVNNKQQEQKQATPNWTKVSGCSAYLTRIRFSHDLLLLKKKKRRHYSLVVLLTHAPTPTSSTITFLTNVRTRAVFPVPYRCPLCWRCSFHAAQIGICIPNTPMAYFMQKHIAAVLLLFVLWSGPTDGLEKPKNE